ncbi:MAG TPA: hypothetical protein ENK14_11055, partial [Caldithrix sp.]|nr:hypothetical protein [Caldithrix sp.]
MKEYFYFPLKSEIIGSPRLIWGRGVVLLLLVILLVRTPVFAGDLYQNWRTLTGKQLNAPDDYKCGFPVVLQMANSRDEQMQKLYASWKSSQADLDRVYYSPSGHFKIRYTLDG